MNTINERIRFFLKSKKITIQSFEKSIGRTNRYLGHTESPTSNVLADIMRVYSELNIEWLITGNGEMKKTENVQKNDVFQENSSVFIGNNNKKSTIEVNYDTQKNLIVEKALKILLIRAFN
ncbi:MAG: helix-turn-helix domain-containing protein [Prevotellaceae bacterium]|jgi:hypothetical protein|nr:helix-turn-helix domain-containing protein [Prevotellaceae bacterium]